MKTKCNSDNDDKRSEENQRWAKEVLGAYNISKNASRKEAWDWARRVIYNRHKSRIFKRNLNFNSFSALITPLCHKIQPRKKKAGIMLEGAKEHQQE